MLSSMTTNNQALPPLGFGQNKTADEWIQALLRQDAGIA